MKKIEFDIGEWVEAKAIVHFNYGYQNDYKIRSPNKREMFRQELGARKKKGRVAGMSYRNIGIRKRDYYNEQAIFTTTKRILVYLIKEGMINKPFECLPKDLKKIPPEEFPFCKSYQMKWTEEDREAASEYANSQMRDSKGRFV